MLLVVFVVFSDQCLTELSCLNHCQRAAMLISCSEKYRAKGCHMKMRSVSPILLWWRCGLRPQYQRDIKSPVKGGRDLTLRFGEVNRVELKARLWLIAAVKRTCAATLYGVGVCINRIGTEPASTGRSAGAPHPDRGSGDRHLFAREERKAAGPLAWPKGQKI